MPNKKNGGIAPFPIDERTKLVPIGCGTCTECRKQKANSWRVRLMEEIKSNSKSLFVNLTFSNESYKELSKKYKTHDENTIATKAVREFLEHRRYKMKKPLKHWFITEKGTKNTERIHIHGITWGENPDYFRENWKWGIVFIGNSCNEVTVNYIVKYLFKPNDKHPDFIPKILCSKGIGKGFFDKKKTVENSKKTNTYRLNNGVIVQLPHYYRNKLFTEKEREKLWIKQLNKETIWVKGNKIERNGMSMEEWTDSVKKAKDYYNIKDEEMGYKSEKYKFIKLRKKNAQKNKLVSKINKLVSKQQKEFL